MGRREWGGPSKAHLGPDPHLGALEETFFQTASTMSSRDYSSGARGPPPKQTLQEVVLNCRPKYPPFLRVTPFLCSFCIELHRNVSSPAYALEGVNLHLEDELILGVLYSKGGPPKSRVHWVSPSAQTKPPFLWFPTDSGNYSEAYSENWLSHGFGRQCNSEMCSELERSRTSTSIL